MFSWGHFFFLNYFKKEKYSTMCSKLIRASKGIRCRALSKAGSCKSFDPHIWFY